ncbi:MAG: bifunctional phosphoglucose/phosphomannose isomerase [Candidatus Eiseniibacteriota bacterium]|jgi:glucose/mannose-6-phosphate isomerase
MALALDSKTSIHKIDRSGMLDLVAGFPRQCEEAVQIGQKAAIGTAYGPFKAIVLAGMGGSAVAGDLLRCYLSRTIDVPIMTVRDYGFPRAVGQGTLVFCSSYSGDTEETLTLYEEARRRRARVLCITTGGKLAEQCGRDGVPWIRIPEGMPPRSALGYLFLPILVTLWRLGVAPPRWSELDDVAERLGEANRRCAVEVPAAENVAKQLARQLRNKLVVVHASNEHLEAAAARWKAQMAENAKVLAFHSLYPEMNHNEICGWAGHKTLASASHVITLRDSEDHPRVQRRMEISTELIGRGGAGVSQVWSGSGTPLARMLSLIHLGDFVSVYLAILRRVDPTPVVAIGTIKDRLVEDDDKEAARG